MKIKKWSREKVGSMRCPEFLILCVLTTVDTTLLLMLMGKKQPVGILDFNS